MLLPELELPAMQIVTERALSFLLRGTPSNLNPRCLLATGEESHRTGSPPADHARRLFVFEEFEVAHP